MSEPWYIDDDLLAVATDEELVEIEALYDDELAALPGWDLLPHQRAPSGAWRHWFLRGGRGTGKTGACAAWLDSHVNGPACDPRLRGGHRVIIIAPSIGDAVESCVTGPSGLQAYNPQIRLTTSKGGTHVRWPNGAEGRLSGAYTREDIERLRAAGNRCAAWVEEVSAWRNLEKCWDHMKMGLRLGVAPRVVGGFTPKSRPFLLEMEALDGTEVTTSSTADNPHLPPLIRAELYARYAGTSLGTQELEGRYVDAVEGALWTAEMLDATRVLDPPEFSRIVIGVDPPGGATECGIVAVGVGVELRPFVVPDAAITMLVRDAYVIEDASLKASPGVWGAQVAALFHRLKADVVVAEANYGGDMVVSTVASADPSVPVKVIHAHRGKVLRAEPVVALFEQGRAHLVGYHPLLEAEMRTWVAGESDYSPNRLDAAVHAIASMNLASGAAALGNPSAAGGRDAPVGVGIPGGR